MYKDIYKLYGLSPDERFYVPDIKMPAALRDFYERFGKYGFNSAYNALLPPDEHSTAKDYVIFYRENQDAVEWAYRKDDPCPENPAVFQTADRENFYREADNMHDFLVSMAYFQGLMGGLPYTGEYDLDFFERQLDRLKNIARLKDGCINPFMGMSFYCTRSDNIIGVTPIDGAYLVMYGGADKSAFDEAERLLDSCLDLCKGVKP